MSNIDRINELINLIKNILLIILIIDFLVLFVLNFKSIYKVISIIANSFIIMGFILIGLTLFINIRLKIHTITLINDVVSELIRKVLGQNIVFVLISGLIISVLGIILSFISNIIIKKQKNSV